MGATFAGNTIYISKDLAEKLNKQERRVLLAHELGHILYKDKAFLYIVVALFFWCPAVVNRFKRLLERRADSFALSATKDIDSFISLMDKLTHDKPTHPTKQERVQFAESLRGRL
jgi:Zn-dependent protease with chaperone function